jgi:hypothetical protein
VKCCHIVIPRAAKQSISLRNGQMDGFVASLFAMTAAKNEES